MVVNDYGSCTAYAPDGEKIEMPKVEDDSNGNHFTTFVKAVHTRKLPFERGEIEAGHYRGRDVPPGEHQLSARASRRSSTAPARPSATTRPPTRR